MLSTSAKRPATLPTPTAEALQHSDALVSFIRDLLAKQDNSMPFSAYMQAALYAPGLGYYTAGAEKFGEAGDFITAPEISPLFGKCIAQQVAEVIKLDAEPSHIIEFGAGSGKLARDILLQLQEIEALPNSYSIIELSPDLQQRQQELLQQELPTEIFQNIKWLTSLPNKTANTGKAANADNSKTIIIANEVLDAMPVELIRKADSAAGTTNSDIEQAYVCWQDAHDRFAINWQAAAPEVVKATQTFADIWQQLPIGYQTEICPAATAWIKALYDCVDRGLVLLIDYGFATHEFMHPDRNMGTLMCHYRHHAHHDPFLYPGLQDITAHVNFTSSAQAAHDAGFDIAGFNHQAAFLCQTGITELLAALAADSADQQATAKQLAASQAVKKLIMPHEMGDLFKVLALTTKLDLPLSGFSPIDQRHKL